MEGKTIAALSKVYSENRRKAAELEAEKDKIKQQMFEYFDTVVGEDEPAEIDCGDGYLFRREVRTSPSIDSVKLEEEVGPDLWKKITAVRRELDETKLKKAIANGVIKKSTVKKCIVEKVTFAFTHPAQKREEK